jgi:hypothetical protein
MERIPNMYYMNIILNKTTGSILGGPISEYRFLTKGYMNEKSMADSSLRTKWSSGTT